jgi:hypothetical protein
MTVKQGATLTGTIVGGKETIVKEGGLVRTV